MSSLVSWYGDRFQSKRMYETGRMKQLFAGNGVGIGVDPASSADTTTCRHEGTCTVTFFFSTDGPRYPREIPRGLTRGPRKLIKSFDSNIRDTINATARSFDLGTWLQYARPKRSRRSLTKRSVLFPYTTPLSTFARMRLSDTMELIFRFEGEFGSP